MKRPDLRVVALTAGLALLATACSGSGTPTASPSGTTPDGGASSGAFQEAHQGGTLKLLAKSAAGSFDPKVNYTLQYWQIFQATYDGLLAFTKVGGDASFTVVPDLAEALPEVSASGKTLTFTLRKGVKFSDGKEVTVDDVYASFVRIFTVSSPTAGSFYNGIVGATECLAKPATCDLSKGVVVDAATNEVVLNLTAPDPELQFKLAVPHAVRPA